MVTLKSILKDSKGVLFHSPIGNSEYAESGKRTVYRLCEENIPVTWTQFSVDDSKNDETDSVFQSIKKTVNKNIEFDTVIFCCTPDVWFNNIEKYKIKFIDKKLIGYPTWETNKLPDLWVKYCNLMDEVWVPSKFNKDVMERCGVEVPIKIVPYQFVKKTLPEINSDALVNLLSISKWYGTDNKLFRYGSDWKIYYTMGEWSDRKNIEDTLKAFCKVFTKEDRVKLIVKVHHIDYSNENKSYCIDRFQTELKNFPDHPEILLITENISPQDVLLIHSIGDCYVSLTRGEGFCLDAWDAFNYNKDIVITEFGGHCDYLGKKYKGYVGFDLINVSFKEKENVYGGDQRWADPNIHDGMDRLKEVYLTFDEPLEKTPITLKNGWYFKEKKNGIVFRQTSVNSTLSINDSSFDYIKLKVKYENGDSTKNLSVFIDSLIKRNVVLTKDITQDVLIPISGVKKIEFSVESDVSKKNNTSLWDHRNVGFLLEGVSLFKDKVSISYTVDKIVTENELTNFHFLSDEEKVVEELTKDALWINSEIQNTKINLSRLEVKDDSEFKGITYIGQYGTSGYASAAKGNLIHFFTKGIPISWIPLYFDNSQLSDECFYNAMVKSLIKKPIEKFDTVFIHATPDIWPELREQNKEIIKGKKVIGYTVWETSKLPYFWVENINRCVDEVWCPSTYNQTVFKNSGVTVPIRVFPHVFMPKELPSKESVSLNLFNGDIPEKESKFYTFYNISELNPRKGVEDLVKTFCEAFSSKDKVRLILKVHYRNYEDQSKKHCIKVLNEIVSSYKKPPKIYYILNNLTEREILGLHSIGDCYVSLCKSEGFGLTIFESFKYNKRVITTGYGGQLDFLGKDYEGLVQYKLGNVVGMNEFSKFYSEDNQQWAYPVLDHARDLMLLSINKEI